MSASVSRLSPIIERLRQGDRVTLTGLGDSLTYGWMVSAGFFDRFCDSTESHYPNARISRLNAGIPGDTAAGGLRRLTHVMVKQPDAVIVQFALNDLYIGVAIEAFRSSLTRIAEQITQAGAVPVLTTSCPVSDETEQQAASRFYETIKAVGAQTDTPVADLEGYWLSRTRAEPPPHPLYQDDGVHPTDAGHAIMAEGLLSLFLAA